MSTVTADTSQNEDSHQSSVNDQAKITILFKAVGGTPVLAKRKLNIDRSETVASLVNYLRKKLRMRPDENVLIFVSSSFTPSLDTDIGTIFDCFSAEGTLFLQYCTTMAWAYPIEAFKPASVFGTPVKILRAHSVRSFIMRILDSLQLSIEGQQEIVLRYRCSDSADYSEIVFRFISTILSSDEDFDADKWKEKLGLALGKIWIRPPSVSAKSGVSWGLLVRNWFQSDPQFPFRDLFDTEMPTHPSRTCLPVYSTNQYGLNLQVLYIFPKLPHN